MPLGHRVRLDDSAAMDRHLKSEARVLEQLGGRIQVNRSVAKVINNQANKHKTLSVRAASAAMIIKQAPIRRRVKVRRATANNHRAIIWYGHQPITMKSLGAKPARKGFRAGKRHEPGAFMGRSRYGDKTQIYRRKGRGRYPIEVVSYPIRDAMLRASDLGDKASSFNLRRELAREMQFRIGRIRGLV